MRVRGLESALEFVARHAQRHFAPRGRCHFRAQDRLELRGQFAESGALVRLLARASVHVSAKRLSNANLTHICECSRLMRSGRTAQCCLTTTNFASASLASFVGSPATRTSSRSTRGSLSGKSQKLLRFVAVLRVNCNMRSLAGVCFVAEICWSVPS